MGIKTDRGSIRRVQIIGSYGFDNFGDELFVATVLQNGDDLWPGATIRTFVPRMWSHSYSSPGALGKFLRLGSALVGLLWADTVAMCGGSVLQDLRGVARFRVPLLRRRRFQALGVSVGPFRSPGGRDRVNELLATAERIVVRDRASISRMETMPARLPSRLGGDLVALNKWVSPSGNRTEIVTVCPSAAAGLTENQVADQVRGGLESVASLTGRIPDVRVLSLSSQLVSNDRPIALAIAREASALGSKVSIESFEGLGLEGTCRAIADSAMVWSQRLHGAIVAYLSAVPFFVVGHHAKCIDFATDIGLDPDLVLNTDEEWGAAACRLVKERNGPQMTPEMYKERARNAYFSSGERLTASSGLDG